MEFLLFQISDPVNGLRSIAEITNLQSINLNYCKYISNDEVRMMVNSSKSQNLQVIFYSYRFFKRKNREPNFYFDKY